MLGLGYEFASLILGEAKDRMLLPTFSVRKTLIPRAIVLIMSDEVSLGSCQYLCFGWRAH